MTKPRFIGTSQRRIEDPPLLTGRGRFVDDLVAANVLHAAFVRSPHAHALIRSIDKSPALALAGVHAVFTLADLMPLLSQERLPLLFRTDRFHRTSRPFVLAKDEVAYVGEAVAIVLADSRYIAEDAAALVAVDYEVLPRGIRLPGWRCARCAAAPTVRGQAMSSTAFRQAYGDVAGAFARAPHRASVNLKQHRAGAHSIEGRGALAIFDANEDRLTLWSSTQLAHEVRAFADGAAAPRREQAARGRAGRRRRLRREVRALSGGGRGHRGGVEAAAVREVGGGQTRALSRRDPGARSVLGSRGRVRE